MKFTNPYEQVPEKNLTRTTIQVSTARASAIHSLHGRKGTLQTTINLLLEKLYDELQRNHITGYDPDRYEIAVGDCLIVLGGTVEHRIISGTVGRPVADSQPQNQTPAGDDNGGTRSLAPVSAGGAVESPVTSGAPAKHGRKSRKSKEGTQA